MLLRQRGFDVRILSTSLNPCREIDVSAVRFHNARFDFTHAEFDGGILRLIVRKPLMRPSLFD